MVSDTIRDLLEHAGIRINGPNPWDIQVHDARWFGRVVREKNLGLGESYMDGWWECGQPDEMICRLLCSGLEDKVRVGLRYQLRLLPAVLFNLQSSSRARKPRRSLWMKKSLVLRRVYWRR